MSHEILTGVLRDELGFKGLIVTDALDMAGATSTYPPNVAQVQAILAGADHLLIPPQMDPAYAAVLDAVRNGTISRRRLDASVYRVPLHKYQHGIFADPMVDPAAAPTIMGAPDHLAEARAITDRTTTLVKNDAGLLPLAAGPRKVLVAGWGVGTTQGIADAVAARGATTQVLESGTTPSGRADQRRRRGCAGSGPRRGFDQQRLRDRWPHRPADRGRGGADPAGAGAPRYRETDRGRRHAQPLRRRLVPRGFHGSGHLRLHRRPGRVAGAGAVRGGEPDRPAPGLDPAR
jgi:beta-glucosidase-like glycosyl hydrolase